MSDPKTVLRAKITLSLTTTFKLPDTPNFIMADSGNSSFPLSDFSDAELEKVGQAWTQELRERARKQREDKKAK